MRSVLTYVGVVVVALSLYGLAYALPSGGAGDGLSSPQSGGGPEPLGYWSGSRAYGDANGDGDVDVADFMQFQACFNGPNAAPRGDNCAMMDFDGDMDVDVKDFMAFQAAFNGPNSPSKNVAGASHGNQNPEPLSVALVGSALGGLVWRGWRRARRVQA